MQTECVTKVAGPSTSQVPVKADRIVVSNAGNHREQSACLARALDTTTRHQRTRSMVDGVHLIERIHNRGALIKVLDKPHLDLTTPVGRGFIAFLSALAEDERLRILARCNEGLAVAKRKGVKFGRRPKLSEHQQAESIKRLAAGESYRSIAKTFGVHHATVARLA
jgi:DNA invertase Pin-like site-specific DNA recombinase